MIPEYTLNNPNYRSYLTKNALYRKKLLNNIKYVNTIYSGFKSDTQEKGILLSKELIAPFDPESMYDQLEKNIRLAIFQGKNVTDYMQSTNLSFQYSHDSFSTTRIDTSIKHYLNTHVEFIKNNNQNEDVFVIGKTFNEKLDALKQVKEKLINNHFTHICFYDVVVSHALYQRDITSNNDCLYRTFRTFNGSNWRSIFGGGNVLEGTNHSCN